MNPPGGNHLDAEVLSDLREGLLTAPEEARISSHLTECAACSGLLAQLDELSDLLISLPAPAPMPPEVALALDTALAGAMADLVPTPGKLSERADRAAPTAAPVPAAAGAGVTAPPTGSGATVTTLPTGAAAARRRRGGPRIGWSTKWLQVAAAAVVVLAIGGLVVPALNNGALDTSGAGQDASSGAAADTGAEADGGDEATAFSAGPVVFTSGTDYTDDTLAAAAPGLAASPPRTSERSSGTDTGAETEADAGGAAEESVATTASAAPLPLSALPPELEALRDPAALNACATQLADGVPTTPLAVDLASYAGEPAAILVQPTPGDPGTLDVFVVAPGCPEGEFRYFTRVPR